MLDRIEGYEALPPGQKRVVWHCWADDDRALGVAKFRIDHPHRLPVMGLEPTLQDLLEALQRVNLEWNGPEPSGDGPRGEEVGGRLVHLSAQQLFLDLLELASARGGSDAAWLQAWTLRLMSAWCLALHGDIDDVREESELGLSIGGLWPPPTC